MASAGQSDTYVVRTADETAGGGRKPSHAEISLKFGADEYDLRAAEAAGRDRQDSYVVRDEREITEAATGASARMTHAQVSALYGSDEYNELRHFQIPSKRQGLEALHRLKSRSYVATTAVSKYQLLFTNAMAYVAYLSWFAVLKVIGAGEENAPNDGAGLTAYWIYAACISFLTYGAFYLALGMYQHRVLRSARARALPEQQGTEFERQFFGKCLSLFSKAGTFVAAYALNEALQQSLPSDSLFWRWFSAGAITLFFAAIVSYLSSAEQAAEEDVPPGTSITSEQLTEQQVHAVVRLRTMWLLNDGWTSSFAWLIAMAWASALRVTFQDRFWDGAEDPKLAPPPTPAVVCAVADAHPCTPHPTHEQIVAEWVLFGVTVLITAATLVAKRNALVQHSEDASFEGKDDGHPCAGCLTILCVMERHAGQGRQTKAMMKGAISGLLLGAFVGAIVGNLLHGFVGASVGTIVGGIALAAAGMGLGATCFKMEMDAAANPIKKGTDAVKMLARGLEKLEGMAEELKADITRAVMVEGVFDELANVLSLAQQLMEESCVWVVSIVLFDAVKFTLYAPSGLMGQWGRMGIVAIGATAIGAAIAMAMDLTLHSMAHDMLHDSDDVSAAARRNLFFYTELAEVLASALGLLIGRTWNFAIVGALEERGVLDKGEHAPIFVYALFTSMLAALLAYRLACDIPDRAERQMVLAPSLTAVEGMSDDERTRDILADAPSLRRVREAIATTEADALDAEMPDPRARVTSIGAMTGIGVGALIGAYVGSRHGFQGTAIGTLAGAAAGGIALGGLFSVIAVLLFPDDSDMLLLSEYSASGMRSEEADEGDFEMGSAMTRKHEVTREAANV